jgi:hypothetical protein
MALSSFIIQRIGVVYNCQRLLNIIGIFLFTKNSKKLALMRNCYTIYKDTLNVTLQTRIIDLVFHQYQNLHS